MRCGKIQAKLYKADLEPCESRRKWLNQGSLTVKQLTIIIRISWIRQIKSVKGKPELLGVMQQGRTPTWTEAFWSLGASRFLLSHWHWRFQVNHSGGSNISVKLRRNLGVEEKWVLGSCAPHQIDTYIFYHLS